MYVLYEKKAMLAIISACVCGKNMKKGYAIISVCECLKNK